MLPLGRFITQVCDNYDKIITTSLPIYDMRLLGRSKITYLVLVFLYLFLNMCIYARYLHYMVDKWCSHRKDVYLELYPNVTFNGHNKCM